MPERLDNRLLTKCQRSMARILVFSPDPLLMTANSDGETEFPDRQLHGFASWNRHLALENGEVLRQLENNLADGVLPDFVQIKQEKVSEGARVLKFEFQVAETSRSEGRSLNRVLLTFEQLSEGQRQLVVLYTILCAAIQPETTVCLDEPDNYIALQELQPWLTLLKDRVQDASGQCLLISHHPELMNYLAAHHGMVVFRDGFGPSRLKRFEWSGDDVLPPADLVARGWK